MLCLLLDSFFLFFQFHQRDIFDPAEYRRSVHPDSKLDLPRLKRQVV
jgi:hypothetical protein